MKPNTIHLLLILLSLSIEACLNSHKEGHIVLTPKKYDASVHIGQGVWLKIPNGYKRADSYEGFQTPHMNSSISVKTTYSPIEEVKKEFDPQFLKKRGMELMELSSVEFGGNDNAFFAVVKDNRKKTVKYLLAVSDGERTYNIKAFCFQQVMRKYDPMIRASILSSFIGEHVEKEELFEFAAIEGPSKFIYTRDGNYPPESDDGAVVEMETIASLQGILGTGLIQSELQKLTGEKRNSVATEFISNGKFYYGTSKSDNKVAFVALVALDEEDKGTLIKAYSHDPGSLADFEEFVRGQFLKVEVRGY